MKKIVYVIAGMLIVFAVPTACSDNLAVKENIVVVEDITEDVDVAVAEDLVAVDILDNNTNNLKINQI